MKVLLQNYIVEFVFGTISWTELYVQNGWTLLSKSLSINMSWCTAGKCRNSLGLKNLERLMFPGFPFRYIWLRKHKPSQLSDREEWKLSQNKHKALVSAGQGQRSFPYQHTQKYQCLEEIKKDTIPLSDVCEYVQLKQKSLIVTWYKRITTFCSFTWLTVEWGFSTWQIIT